MDLSIWPHDAKRVTATLKNVQIAFGIRGGGAGIDQRTFGRLCPVLRDALFAVSGYRLDDA